MHEVSARTSPRPCSGPGCRRCCPSRSRPNRESKGTRRHQEQATATATHPTRPGCPYERRHVTAETSRRDASARHRSRDEQHADRDEHQRDDAVAPNGRYRGDRRPSRRPTVDRTTVGTTRSSMSVPTNTATADTTRANTDATNQLHRCVAHPQGVWSLGTHRYPESRADTPRPQGSRQVRVLAGSNRAPCASAD